LRAAAWRCRSIFDVSVSSESAFTGTKSIASILPWT
jgi:hypothetical protein